MLQRYIILKIHIVGCSGTGKTYLATALSKKYDITHFYLDDIQWDNNSDGFHQRNHRHLVNGLRTQQQRNFYRQQIKCEKYHKAQFVEYMKIASETIGLRLKKIVATITYAPADRFFRIELSRVFEAIIYGFSIPKLLN